MPPIRCTIMPRSIRRRGRSNRFGWKTRAHRAMCARQAHLHRIRWMRRARQRRHCIDFPAGRRRSIKWLAMVWRRASTATPTTRTIHKIRWTARRMAVMAAMVGHSAPLPVDTVIFLFLFMPPLRAYVAFFLLFFLHSSQSRLQFFQIQYFSCSFCMQRASQIRTMPFSDSSDDSSDGEDHVAMATSTINSHNSSSTDNTESNTSGSASSPSKSGKTSSSLSPAKRHDIDGMKIKARGMFNLPRTRSVASVSICHAVERTKSTCSQMKQMTSFDIW